MLNRITILFITGIAFSLQGQQFPVFTNFYQNPSYFNPSQTALHDQHFGNVQYRNQWTGIDGAPITFMGQYEMDIKKYNSGIGINYVNDNIGFIQSNYSVINYRYQLKIKDETSISFGVAAGAEHITVDFEEAIPSMPDPMLPDEKRSQTKMVINAGTYLKWRDLGIGLSATHLNRARYDDLLYRSVIHFVLTADYQFKIGENMMLVPNLFTVTERSSFSAMLNLRGVHNQRFWWMLGYRYQDSFSIGGGVTFWKDRMQVGYSLDIITSSLSNYATGSHELFLTYRIFKR